MIRRLGLYAYLNEHGLTEKIVALFPYSVAMPWTSAFSGVDQVEFNWQIDLFLGYEVNENSLTIKFAVKRQSVRLPFHNSESEMRPFGKYLRIAYYMTSDIKGKRAIALIAFFSTLSLSELSVATTFAYLFFNTISI